MSDYDIWILLVLANLGMILSPLYLLSFFMIFRAKRKKQPLAKRYSILKIISLPVGASSLLVTAYQLHLIMTSNPNKGYANGIVFYCLLMMFPLYLCALIFLFIDTGAQKKQIPSPLNKSDAADLRH